MKTTTTNVHLGERELHSLAGTTTGPSSGDGTRRAAAASARARQHLDRCRTCREELELRTALGGALPQARSSRVQTGPCPPTAHLAQLALGELPAHARAAIEAHAASCAACTLTLEDAIHGAPALGRIRAGSRSLPSLVDRLAEALRALVGYEMPVFAPAVTRSAAVSELGTHTRRALSHYQAGRYVKAIAGLEDAGRRGEEGAERAFYLGTSLLHEGRAAEAIAVLRELAATRNSGGDVHWFLAQAHLMAGDGAAALAAAEIAIKRRGPYQAAARELRRSLLRLLGNKSS